MQYRIYFLTLFLLLTQPAMNFAQTIQRGSKVQVMVNGTWKEAVVVKSITGRTVNYQLQMQAGNGDKKTQGSGYITVPASKVKLSALASQETTNKSVETNNKTASVALKLGRYELFSGIPRMSIGHFIILPEGKYKVAFNDQDVEYENGTYIFHPETNSIEWLSGLFYSSRWAGRFVQRNANSFRIEFNKVTFGESE